MTVAAARTDVLSFWFAEAMSARWFVKDPAFDRLVRARLGRHHEAAGHGTYDDLRDDAGGCVALCVLLDQVPRNLFRDDPRAYACDDQALAVARHAFARGFDAALGRDQRLFLYMPLQHSERLADQDDCVRRIAALAAEPKRLDYAKRHRDIIARFGRFPHRNAVLGRVSTAAEEAFLTEPNSSF